MENELIILLTCGFTFLLVTHYIALQIGFKMGSKANSDVFLSKPENGPHTDYVDHFEQYTYDLE